MCGVPTESTTDPAPSIHEIEYEHRWDWGKATPLDGGGWSVTNDEGFFIQVLSGGITHYSVQLVPCEPPVSAMRWKSIFGISNAWAGHSEIAPDPSLITQQNVQSLVNPVTVRTANVTVKDHTYCQVHAVLGPADTDANGLDMHGFMADQTLVLSGLYRAPNSNDDIPFQIESDLGIGEFFDWDGSQVDMNGTGVRVVLTHRLDTLFDHIRLDTQHPNEVSWFVMTNALTNTTVQVQRSTARGQ